MPVPSSVDTVRQLADTMLERYRAFVILGAGTGVRIGEALGLTVDRVDFLRRSVGSTGSFSATMPTGRYGVR